MFGILYILLYIECVRYAVLNKAKKVNDVVTNKSISDSKWRSIRQKILVFCVLDYASILSRFSLIFNDSCTF